ncbi:uncharacterized protein METZ01_LOCUS93619, partial [marine metagenome]
SRRGIFATLFYCMTTTPTELFSYFRFGRGPGGANNHNHCVGIWPTNVGPYPVATLTRTWTCRISVRYIVCQWS